MGLADAARRLGHLIALAALWFCPGASTGAEPTIAIPGYNQFTEQDEARIGAALTSQFESKYPAQDNSPLNSYLGGLVRRLADQSRRPGLTYNCKVLNQQNGNAFSLPGGQIYVTRGLLDFTQTESELAAVIAHEMGHLAARHALSRFSLELRSKEVWGTIRSKLPDLASVKLEQTFQAAGAPLVDMLATRYDQASEKEADLLAFYNLIRSGWNPAGELGYIGRTPRAAGEPDLFAEWRLSHPDDGSRGPAIAAEMKVVTLSPSLDDNSMAFRAMKLGLKLLPKASQAK